MIRISICEARVTPDTVPVLVAYYPKPETSDQLLPLILRHWPVLSSLGLVSETRPQVWRAVDKRSGEAYIVVLFEWRDGSASDTAHQLPEVMAIWEPMGAFLSDMRITRLERVPLGY